MPAENIPAPAEGEAVYHSVQFAKGAPLGWVAGTQGRIAKIKLSNKAKTD